MSLRTFLKEIDVVKINEEVDPELEIAKILRENEGKTVLFENVKNSGYSVVGGVCSSRGNFARALGINKDELIPRIAKAIENPKEPELVEDAPCQEIIEREIDLSKIPVLTHSSKDQGPYITAGVFIATDPEYGLNASFHRSAVLSKNKLVARICERDLYKYLQRSGGELEVSISIGNHPSLLLAAGISSGITSNELAIANSLHPLKLVKCKTNNLLVPAESELILEGIITRETHGEGPFPDITETYDTIRDEPVIEINCITHRKYPIYQALLPGSMEHRLLMGMPKEPVILREINRVCRCRDALLTIGGCSWLHGIVQIEKKDSDDGKKAIESAFKAHKSLKHLVIVDDDINIHNPKEVEWAIATRFQAEKDLVLKREKGSSLDPSAGEDRITSKVGLDATIPWEKDRKKFERVRLGE